MPSGNRDRLVDCMEEFVKYTIVMRPHFHIFGDRCSEREERREKELLLKEKASLTDGHNGVMTDKPTHETNGVNGINEINGVQLGSL